MVPARRGASARGSCLRAGGINFGTHFLALRRGTFGPYLGDPEMRAFLGVVGGSVLLLSSSDQVGEINVARRELLRATPLRASQLVLATALQYMIVGLLSVASMFLVATILFDFSMRGSYLALAAFAVIGIFCLFGFGLAIGGWAKNENQSAPLSNLVAFPMMKIPKRIITAGRIIRVSMSSG